MNIEAVIAWYLAQGLERGKTASPGNSDFDRARDLDFQLCRCSAGDLTWSYPEHIARTARGGLICVGASSRSNKVTCGSTTYHHPDWRKKYGRNESDCI